MFKSLFLGVSAFAAFVAAQNQLYFKQTPPQAVVGTTYQITYNTPAGNTNPVTITLRNGPSGNLGTISTLTSSATGGTYSWTPDSSLVSGTYALSISQKGSDDNYSAMFQLTGGAASSSLITSATSSAASSSGSSAAVTSSGSSSSKSSSSSPAYTSSYAYTPAPTGGATTGGSSPYGGGSNSSYSSPTIPSATSRTGSSATAAATTAKASGAASTVGSSMALVMGAVAAFAFLN